MAFKILPCAAAKIPSCIQRLKGRMVLCLPLYLVTLNAKIQINTYRSRSTVCVQLNTYMHTHPSPPTLKVCIGLVHFISELHLGQNIESRTGKKICTNIFVSDYVCLTCDFLFISLASCQKHIWSVVSIVEPIKLSKERICVSQL